MNDAYRPEQAHSELLSRTKADAEADAIRHAEDMLERVFPIGVRAKTTAESRLTALHVAYEQKRHELEEATGLCEKRIEAAVQQRKDAEDALVSAGVPEGQLGLEPMRAEPEPLHVAVALGAALLVGMLAFSELGLSPLLAIAIGALCGAAAWLPLAPRPLEPAEITEMRESRSRAASLVRELDEELVRHREEAKALPGKTLAIAEDELRFAEEMAGAYASAVFSALPAGALSNGRAVAEQPPTGVTLPEWVQELEAPE